MDAKTQQLLREKYNPDGSTLRQYQLHLLEMLKWFDNFCQKNKITYWLSSGTCLGAVRHSGFIPWDDDVDVEMLREDYLKLEKLFKETDDYALQTFKNDKYYCLPFAKLRDKHSKIVEPATNGLDNYYKYQGAFIDIFQLEYSPKRLVYILDYLRGHIATYGYSLTSKKGFTKMIAKALYIMEKKIFFNLAPTLKRPFKIYRGGASSLARMAK